MEKIIVIGSPGAGKSSFSKKLKNITQPFTTQKWAVYDVKVAHFYG